MVGETAPACARLITLHRRLGPGPIVALMKAPAITSAPARQGRCTRKGSCCSVD